MDREELLEMVAQLNPASPSSTFYGFHRSLNPHDVAYCLSKIPEEGPSYYGRLKFAGQEVWAKDAAIRLSMSLLNRLPGYKTPKRFIGHNMIIRICQASIWEHLGNTLCPECNGKGDFRHGALLVICPTCEGFRTVSASTNRHKAFDMDIQEWKKRWEHIYLMALKILDQWERMVLSVMIQNYGITAVRGYLGNKSS